MNIVKRYFVVEIIRAKGIGIIDLEPGFDYNDPDAECGYASEREAEEAIGRIGLGYGKEAHLTILPVYQVKDEF